MSTPEANLIEAFRRNKIVVPDGLQPLLTKARRDGAKIIGSVQPGPPKIATIHVHNPSAREDKFHLTYGHLSASVTEQLSKHNFQYRASAWSWHSDNPWDRTLGTARGKQAVETWLATSPKTPSFREVVAVEQLVANGQYVVVTVRLTRASSISFGEWSAYLEIRPTGRKNIKLAKTLESEPSEALWLYIDGVLETSWEVEFEE